MKVHYQHPTYGVVCNTNRTRKTSHTARVTQDKDKVTCDTCRKQHGIGCAEVAK